MPAFLRLVFAGTPEFAERALARLLDAGHDVALVLTQPDRPAGRGLRAGAERGEAFSPRSGALPLFQPLSLKAPPDVGAGDAPRSRTRSSSPPTA